MHMVIERYQQNNHKWQTWPPLTVGLPVTSERYWASFQVTRLFHKVTVSQCDNFFFCCHICLCCLKLHQADYKIEEFLGFFNLNLVGTHSAPMYSLFAPYTDLGRRGYFGVSNVALVFITFRIIAQSLGQSDHHPSGNKVILQSMGKSSKFYQNW